MLTLQTVTYRTVDINGIHISYREAGDPKNPQSCFFMLSRDHMYRDLILLLEDRFHLILPNYEGSGNSEYPSDAKFKPTFANLADLMGNFIVLSISSYTFRILARRLAFVSQSHAAEEETETQRRRDESSSSFTVRPTKRNHK